MEKRAETIMLTGATGHVGLETLLALNQKYKGIKVKVLIHEQTEAKADTKFSDLNVEKVLLKEGEKERAEVFKGVHSLFIIPPPVENRVELVKNIILSAKQAGVKFIMTPSHVSVRQKDTVLARTYRQIEDEIKRSGIPHCFLHSEHFMDTFLADADDIKRTSSFRCCINNDAKFNPIAVRDLGEVAAHILVSPYEHEDTRYTLTGPKPLSMTEIAETFSKLLGRDIKYIQEEPEKCVRAMVDRGSSEWFAKGMVELEQSITSEDEEFTSGDLTKLLDRHPVSFERFIQEHKNIFV